MVCLSGLLSEEDIFGVVVGVIIMVVRCGCSSEKGVMVDFDPLDFRDDSVIPGAVGREG